MITRIVLHNLFTGGASLCFGHTKTTCPPPDSRCRESSRWSPSNQIKETSMIKTEYKKGGRPAKGATEKKKYRITVKLNTQDYYREIQ